MDERLAHESAERLRAPKVTGAGRRARRSPAGIRLCLDGEANQTLGVLMEVADGGVRVQQRLDALARANRLRTARAALKRRIAAGELSCANLILRPGWEIERMPIAKLLASQRSWGDERCRKFFREMKISPTRPVGSLTERERRMLAQALRRGNRPKSASASAVSAGGRSGRAAPCRAGVVTPTPASWQQRRSPAAEGLGNIDIISRSDDTSRMLKLSGEFDLSNARTLGRAITAALDAGTPNLLIDLTDVAFLDAATLTTLDRGRRQAAKRRASFVLVHPPLQIWRLFVLTGLSRAFPRVDSVEDAMN